MRGHLGGTVRRPAFGSVVSRLRGGNGRGALPTYVALGGENGADPGDPSYLGTAHRAFETGGQSSSSHDAFAARALEMITSPKARDAFDVSMEPKALQERYGPGKRLLQALRLAQAGVSVETVSVAGTVVPVGDWDTHGKNGGSKFGLFEDFRQGLPVFDKVIHAFLYNFYERGLYKKIADFLWGEFGRTPKINKDGGRVLWAPAGHAMIAGGGFKMGQVIGDTG